ncbi:MAG: serine/threonine protein kinase, partial [Planctomycetes bacterium]|nr:serine/threonine protein kinase [Planctomycetota bacterium]
MSTTDKKPAELSGQHPPAADGEVSKTVTMAWPTASGGEVTIPSTIGNVKVEQEIGRGGLGIVFRGWDQMLHRPVAVKFLLDVAAGKDDLHFERFFGGARAEAAVRHPNIVAVHTAGQIEGLPYLIQDYIEGPTLHELAVHAGRLSLATAVKVMWDVAGAVAVLHERDLVHRDLKPRNVLFDLEGHALVTDFGLASLRRRSASAVSIAGTPAYMAPETFDGTASPQSDVYAMGIMLFELLAGRRPFAGDLAALRDYHANAPLPVAELAASVPAPIVEIIERAAHKKEMFRYKTAEHFLRALLDAGATDQLLREGGAELKRLVIQCLGKDAGQGAAPPGTQTPTTTYFDRLSEITDHKRGSSASAAQRAPQATSPAQDREDVARSPEHLLCIHCGYNLRGLATDGLCPECGTPIHRSIHGDLLSGADPAWLTRVSRGVTLIYAAVVTCLASIVLLILLILGVRGPAVYTVEAVGAFLTLLGAILLLLGILGLTTPDPRLTLTEQPVAFRRIVRGGAIAGLLIGLCRKLLET